MDTGKKGERWDNNHYTILPLSNLVFGKDEDIEEKEPDTGKNNGYSTEKPVSSYPVSGKPHIGKNLDISEKKPVE